MHSPSLFQLLPPHVARLVVNHVVGSSRLVFDGVYPDTEAFKMLLKPLLGVCHNFRDIALPLYCSRCEIALDKSLSIDPDEPFVDRCCLGLGYPAHHLAKELSITMEERDIYTGAALRALSHEYNDDGAFPLVRALTLVLEPSESYESSESEHSDEPEEPVDMNKVYQTNVSAFLSWIKRMLPKVNDVNIVIDDYTSPDDTLTQHFGRLVAQLYRLGSSVKYSSKDERDTLVASQLEEIRDLVHISFEDAFGCNQSSYLARRNS
ncbi:hypothetical protein GGI08_000587 [Coemansia sp. S2]|nr:hypothetical protein GGI08_000587 [Coemansia sp. S2]KAJ2110860.1 hypothetical protein GGI16_000108 [Coemansia sp. S142-1]KAJ2354332.1 hypothetical protein GGH92_000101 [Coemansia sp. RSA 2673]KAJ2430780.1 hypothetical protein GGF41_000835 [Coemansia sp. RSA 2531]